MDQLSDGERDYVLRVIELQSGAKPDQAQGIAALSNVATAAYLRNAAFSHDFANAVSSYALTISGAKASADAQNGADSDHSPGVAGAAAALGETQAAAVIISSSGQNLTQAPSSLQAAFQAPTARVFFQVAAAGDRAVANGVNQQLTALLGKGLTPVNGVETVPSFTGPTQIRYFFQNDKKLAEKIASALAGALPGIECRYIRGYETSGKARPQLFEVWLAPGVVASGPVRLGASGVSC